MSDPLLERIQLTLAVYVPSVVGAVLTLLVGWWAVTLVTKTTRRVLARSRAGTTLAGFLSNSVYAGGMTLVVIATLGRLGVETTSFIAVLGAAGLAVGLAFQGSLSNFASGVLIVTLRPFSAGDFVEAAGTMGTVEEITVFQTILKTPDAKRVIVGNAAVLSSTITNYSAHDTRRIDLVFGIGYDDDLRKAKSVIERLLSEDERILDDPAPLVGVIELGDSSVNLAVRPWVKRADYFSVLLDLNERVKLAFDTEGISIPFPQRDVHLHQAAREPLTKSEEKANLVA